MQCTRNMTPFVLLCATTILPITAWANAADDANVSVSDNTAGTSTASTTVGNAFNPKISLILDGAYQSAAPTNGYLATGQNLLQSNATTSESGLSLGESEIVLDATVDQYWDGRLNLSVNNDGATAEEAWIKTRALPYGLTLKAGKMLSGIGYRNEQHAHVWDFSDLSLPYQAFFGGDGLKDMGVQMTWLPATQLYSQIGLELLKGAGTDSFATRQEDLALAPYAATQRTSATPNITTAYIRVSPELAGNHTLQLGAWVAHAAAAAHIYQDSTQAYLLQGGQLVTGLNAVYKWDSPKLLGVGNIKLVAELMQAHNQNNIATIYASNALTPTTASAETRQGYALEGSYGIAPRWSSSLRVDGLSASDWHIGTTTLSSGANTRLSTALSFTPSEFSRVRLQLSHGRNAASGTQSAVNDTQYMLQYTMSLGTHGAHSF